MSPFLLCPDKLPGNSGHSEDHVFWIWFYWWIIIWVEYVSVHLFQTWFEHQKSVLASASHRACSDLSLLRIGLAPHLSFRRIIRFFPLYCRLALCYYGLANLDHLHMGLRHTLMALCSGCSEFLGVVHFSRDQTYRTVCSMHFQAAISNFVWAIYNKAEPYVPLCLGRFQLCSL